MNSLGLQYLLKMGCICGKEALTINNRRFLIRSRLGEGGFSVIDLVEDARTHKLYALKRITCHGKEDEQIANREIELMKTFKHSNLVPVDEYGTITAGYHVQSGDPITETLIVMPFYKRGTIQEKINGLVKKSEKISEETIWSVFYGVCKAVKEMHSNNPPYAHSILRDKAVQTVLKHYVAFDLGLHCLPFIQQFFNYMIRDIKPGNVMMNDDGTPVLMDLGSANKARVEIKSRSEAQALQDEAAERCSMLFRPPELFAVEPGTNVDERTDIWSLGCLLYSMAFLESPFEKVYQRGDSIALAVLGRNISFPSNSGYTSSIEELICECMVVNPMERPFIDQILNKTQTLAKSSSNVA